MASGLDEGRGLDFFHCWSTYSLSYPVVVVKFTSCRVHSVACLYMPLLGWEWNRIRATESIHGRWIQLRIASRFVTSRRQSGKPNLQRRTQGPIRMRDVPLTTGPHTLGFCVLSLKISPTQMEKSFPRITTGSLNGLIIHARSWRFSNPRANNWQFPR